MIKYIHKAQLIAASMAKRGETTSGRRCFLSNSGLAALALAAALAVAAPAEAISQRDVLIKAPGQESAVYYLANNGKRYVFPNEGTFYSWYKDFSSLIEVPFSELVSYPLGGNVTYRAGYKMIKITTDPKVYAVGRGGVLHWVTSETVARRLYGSDWNKQIHDVPDEFFVNYTVGAPIYTDSDFVVADQLQADTSIGADKSLAVSAGVKLADTAADTGDAAAIRAATPAPAAPSCTADTWECSSWGACVSGIQTRSCMVTSDCPGVQTPGPSSAQSCSGGQTPAAGIMISMVSLPTSVIANGAAVAARFSASAGASADSQLTVLRFPIDKSRELTIAGSGDSSLRPVGLGTNLAGTAVLDTCNNLSVQCSVTVTLLQAFTIPAGTSQAFDLRLNVSGSTSGSYMETSMDQPVDVGPWTLAGSQSPTQSCSADTWDCSSWSTCTSGGVQTRICSKTLDCPGVDTASPVATQSCTPPPLTSSFSVSANLPASASVDPGDSNVPMLGFTLSAGSADYLILSITAGALIDGNNDGVFGLATDAGAAFTSDVTACRLYDGSTQVGSAATPNAQGMVAFGLLSVHHTVPAGGNWALTVKCDISASAGQHKIALSLTPTNNMVPVGASGPGVLLNDGVAGLPVNGNGTTSPTAVMTIAAPAGYAGPVISLVALPSTVLTTGEVAAFRFSISSADDSSIKHLTARVSPSMANAVAISTAGGSSIRRVGEGSNLAGAARINGGAACLGNGNATCDVEIGLASEEVVAGGASRTYDLRLNLAGSLVSGDSLTVSLLGDSGAPVTGQLTQVGGAWDYRVSGGGDNFVWSDNSAIPHSDALAPTGSADWTNGLYVHGLPTDTETMSK